MTNWRKGDVILVPIAFTDGSGVKRRPAVIVSSDRYNSESPDVMIASITSNIDAIPHPGDCVLSHWKEAGLLRPSLAQAKIATIEASLIARHLGRLSDVDMTALDQGLREALALSSVAKSQ